MKEDKFYILYTLDELNKYFFKDQDGDFWFSELFRDQYDAGRPVNTMLPNSECFEIVAKWEKYYLKSSCPKNLPNWVIKFTGTQKEYPEYFI